MVKFRKRPAPEARAGTGSDRKNECRQRFAVVARTDEERMARKLANATANAASTLRQQRLESHGSAQPDERHSQQRPESPSLAKPPQKRSQQRLASTSQEKLPREAGPRSRIDGCRTSHYNSRSSRHQVTAGPCAGPNFKFRPSGRGTDLGRDPKGH